MKVWIDPGHGGEDSGAVGPSGVRESTIALEISRYILLGLTDTGCEINSTRSDDSFVSLSGRCKKANAWNADLFVSIHCNAFSNPTAHGFEVWTSRGETAADPIATRLYGSIKAAFPELLPRVDLSDGDCDKESGFAVLRGTAMPAVLIECAFISNVLEERWLRDVGWRMRMAGAIVSAV